MANWDEQYLRETGCVYNYRTVICQNRTKCDKCGWKPEVELERKKKFRAWCKETGYGLGRV